MKHLNDDTEYQYSTYVNIPVHRKLFLMQMASALEFLHQKHVIYFDLKSDNVLAWKFPLPSFSKLSDQDVLLKITDYGISRVSSTEYEIRTSNVCGTPGYIAPEVLLGKNTLQADKVQVNCSHCSQAFVFVGH